MSSEKLRILLVCANPRGTDPLRTAEEDRTLRESIRLSPKREHFEVETLNAATIDDLRRTLLRKSFDIVHFSGHGTQTGLVFEDALGRRMIPPSCALADLLQRRNVRVALLNACYSLSLGRITAIGVDYTIASSGPMSDPGAIEFTRGFYDALGAGTDVPDAYAEGVSAAKLKGYELDAVLLRRGEEFVAAPIPPRMVGPQKVALSALCLATGVGLLVSSVPTIGLKQANVQLRSDSSELSLVGVDAGPVGQRKLRQHGGNVVLSMRRYVSPPQLLDGGLYTREAVLDVRSLDPSSGRVMESLEIRQKGTGRSVEGSTLNALSRLQESAVTNISGWPWM